MTSDLCAYDSCTRIATVRYMVSGEAGVPGKAGYCDTHAESFAKPSAYHSEVQSYD